METSTSTSSKRPKHNKTTSENDSTDHKNSKKSLPDKWERCHAYMLNKKRFCRQIKCSLVAHQVIKPSMTKAIYCGQHLDLLSPNSDEIKEGIKDMKNVQAKMIRGKRIPCPVDPSHTIYESNLHRHIRICPRAKQNNIEKSNDYYRKDTNRGGHGDDLSCAAVESKCLNQNIRPELLVKSIFAVYKTLFMPSLTNKSNESITFEEIYASIILHDLHGQEEQNGLITSIDQNRIKTNGWKNRIQIGSILGNLHRVGCFQTSTEEESIVVIEMGAGRGIFGLLTAGRINSRVFQKNCNTSTTLIMLDRSGARHKSDGTITKVKNQNTASDNHLLPSTTDADYLRLQNINSRRIRCDISHVHLPLVLKQQQKQYTKLIYIAKHLCGAGTDIALKSLTQLTSPKEAKSYYVFATCCHGVCTWEDYVGRAFLQNLFLKSNNNFVLKEQHFNIMKRWACSAATCQNNHHDNNCTNQTEHNSKKEDDQEEEEEEDHPSSTVNNDETPDDLLWAIQQVIHKNKLSCTKRGLGRICQRLIDYGRMEYMKHVLKMDDVQICHYVSDDITPQNALIIGVF